MFGNVMCGILLFFIFQINIFLSDGQVSGQNEFVNAAKRLGAMNILDYNDKCSFEEEERRSTVGKKILDMMLDLDYQLFSNLAEEMNELVEESSGQFCNALKNLHCSSAGICECVNVNANTHMTTTKSIRENNTCRLAGGSSCAPQETLKEVDGRKPDLKCQRWSECIVKYNGMPCTIENLKDEIMRTLEGGYITSKKNILAHTKDRMARDDLCICSEPTFPYAQYINSVDHLVAKRSLNYRDECEPEDPDIETAVNSLQEINETTLLPSISNNIKSMDDLTNLIERSSQSCNPIKVLQCSSGSCKCANSFSGIPIKTVRESDKCRLATGSTCSHSKFLPRIGNAVPELKCQIGSECLVAARAGVLCTSEIMEHELKRFHESSKTAFNKSNVIKMISEPFCVCGSGASDSIGYNSIGLIFSLLIFIWTNSS